jgi:hypothetical protein
MSAAERQRRYRQRRKIGARVYRLTLEDASLEAMLAELGFINEGDGDDHAQVEHALKQFIEFLASCEE